jgi:hypothetical protein
MSLQPSRATGRSDNSLYTWLLVISAVSLLVGFILLQIDLYAAYKVIWLFKA